MAVYCLGGCEYKDIGKATRTVVDFTLDLSLPENKTLKTSGGYVIANNVVVAFTTVGTFAAVTLICSHEGYSEIVYDYARNLFSCGRHGAEFDTDGKGLNARGVKGLKTYTTFLNGNLLRVAG